MLQRHHVIDKQSREWEDKIEAAHGLTSKHIAKVSEREREREGAVCTGADEDAVGARVRHVSVSRGGGGGVMSHTRRIRADFESLFDLNAIYHRQKMRVLRNSADKQ